MNFFKNEYTKVLERKRDAILDKISVCERYTPAYNVGLNDEQIKERVDKELTNKRKKVVTKSYFKIVFDNILDIARVKIIPNKITNITDIVAIIDAPIPCIVPVIKIVAIVIRNGNLPLHGTKLFVSIAINLSLGESIILHPVTPQALQPNPMHMVVTIWYI